MRHMILILIRGCICSKYASDENLDNMFLPLMKKAFMGTVVKRLKMKYAPDDKVLDNPIGKAMYLRE